jgi:hypothetical protein
LCSFFFQITIEGYFKENTLKGRHFEDLHHTEKIYRTALCALVWPT